MAKGYIRTEYGNTVVLSNIRKGKASIPVIGMNDSYTATKVTTWWDGSPMTPEKADGSVYLMLTETGEYFRVNLPNDGELFLEKDTVAQMRGLSSTEILLLKMGYYKGVTLNGYYNKQDTPASIDYTLSDTSEEDDGGSVFEVGGIKLEHDFKGYLNVKYFGASGELSTIENKEAVERSLYYLDRVSGGELSIPYDINYGYKRNNIQTHPNVKDYINNDIIINDYSKGDTYTGQSRDGAQYRVFFCTQGGSGDGFTDTQGEMIRGNWHPYIMLFNDEDPLLAKRRHATVFFGTNGRVNWGVGQGINTREVTGTDEDKELSQFKIVGDNVGIDSGLTTIMAINKTNGFWGFNTDTPNADYHFVTRRKSSAEDATGSYRVTNNKGGDLQIQIGVGAVVRRLIYDKDTNDISLTNTGGARLWVLKEDGTIVIGTESSGVDIKQGTVDPNGNITGRIGSLYFRKSAPSAGTGIYVKESGNNTNTGWIQIRGTLYGTTAQLNSINASFLAIGQPAFDTTIQTAKNWNGTSWVNSSPDASPTIKGLVNQATAVADITVADATDEATAIALANANKAKINEFLAALRTAGILAT